jgi:hypothetical protein
MALTKNHQTQTETKNKREVVRTEALAYAFMTVVR